MLLEIHRQPDLLRRLLGRATADLAPLIGQGRRGRLWFVGCGDMHFAAVTAADVAECRFGRVARALRSMDMRWWRDRLAPEDLVVCASVSGRTPRTLEALGSAVRAGARTLAVTDDPDSPLAERAGQVLLLRTVPAEQLDDAVYPGYAALVPQTRSYMAVLLVLLLLASQELDWVRGLCGELERWMEPVERRARRNAELMCAGSELREVLVLGSGPHLGSAGYGAAKLLEYAIPARAQCLEEFHHLEMFTLSEGSRIVALAPDGASARRWEEVRGAHQALGAASLEWSVQGEEPGLPERPLQVAVFVSALALQLQAYYLAHALGRDVNRWVGGLRTEQVFRLSNRTVRGSKVEE
jgi:glucosamine--fructose-6-phosphate aminotransferase (isomerizing)